MSKPLLKTIVVAINGSQSSIQAAMYGIILAKQHSLRMKAVFVVDTATIKYLTNYKFFAAEERDAYETDLQNDGNKYLEYVLNLAKSKGVKIDTELRSGSVWTEIIHAADEAHADMILIGGHHNADGSYIAPHSGHRSVISIARSEIVEYAHCPVLVIHKPEIEALFKIS
ncbi:MAG: universal stress protein [Treponemataceae bacterium]|nr:universal stress protein [Treponemataceae bacterium]